MPLQAELQQVTALEPLRDDWAALWTRIPDATPFQHPAWLVPWWRHVGEGRLCCLALREETRLRAFMPFYVYDAERKLFPLGIGTTDYLDALVEPGAADAAMDAAFAHLAKWRGAFARIEWPQLRPASPLLRGTAPRGWHDATEGAEPCPVLELPAAFDGLRARISTKTLRDLRTARRRAEEAGATFETATPSTLDEIGEALFRLHGARWAMRGEEGVLAASGVQQAHREAMPALMQAGLLRLFAIRLGGRVVAVVHALADPPDRPRRALYLYLQGFDPGLERLSPGLLLVGEAVGRAIEEGFHAIDFLRGQERYKSFWGAVNAPTFRRVLVPPEEAA